MDLAVVGSGAGARVYSGGAPGLAFTVSPARFVTGSVLVLTVLGASLPRALGALAVRRSALALGAAPDRAQMAACAHALGTIALPFATRLYAHSLVVCLLAWSLALVLERKKPALAGLLAAWAVVCDYNVALAAGALVLLLAVERDAKAVALFLAGALGPALLLAAYHAACFGAPWKTPYDFHADATTQRIVKSAYGFSWPRPRIVLELLLGTRRGFLFTQPIALAGLVGLGVHAARRDRRGLLGLGVALVVLLVHASRSIDWHAGSSYGARYSAHALPFIALGYPALLDLVGRARVPLLLASFVAALVGATSDWGFDVRTSWETLGAMGPRASSLVVLLGLDDHSLGAALVSTAAIVVVLPALVALLARPRLEWMCGAAVGGFLFAAPGLYFTFMHGRDLVLRERMAIGRAQMIRVIDSSADLEEARLRLGQVQAMGGDAELVARARERVAAFERE